MRLKLKIEPIPICNWGISLSSRVSIEEWEEIRYGCYRKNDYTCEICGSPGHNCHEVWGYDDSKLIQRLVALECLCDLCHDVHHFGRCEQTKSKTYLDKLEKHWCKINRKTVRDFNAYRQELFEMSKYRADKFYIIKIGRRILT